MGPLHEPGWQKRSRTKSCGEYQHSNVSKAINCKLVFDGCIHNHQRSYTNTAMREVINKGKLIVNAAYIAATHCVNCHLLQKHILKN